MSRHSQAQFSLRAKTALLRRGLSIAALARQIDRSRTATSQAINHGKHPKTKRLVADALNLKAS